MTDSKNNVRRSIGPRRTGEGEHPAGTDPLAELTRFMDRDADQASWPSRRAAPARGGDPLSDDAGETPARPPVRRHPAFDDLPTFEEDAAGEALDEEDASAGEDDAPAQEFGEPEYDATRDDDDQADPEEDERAGTSQDTDFSEAMFSAEDDEPEDAGEGEAEADDPFMQALMQELESDSAPAQETPPAPRVRPSFAFPGPRTPVASAEDGPKADDTAGEPGPAASSEEPAKPAPTPSPAWRPASPASPTVRSRATPVAPPPVQATVPKPLDRLDADRLQHARDHAAISSEADGALEQLRSRLARGPQTGTPQTPKVEVGEASKPAPVRPVTSWTPPPLPSGPVGDEADDGSQPAEPDAAPFAKETQERPSFVRAQPAPGSTGQGTAWSPRPVPAAEAGIPDDRFDEADDVEIDDEGTVEFDELDREADLEGAADAERTDEAEADAGWTLDEDELANAIALSVGGARHGDDDDIGVDDDARYDDLLAAEDDELFDEGDDAGAELGDTSAIDELDFEFELQSTAPAATADDFRKPSQRSEPSEPLEPFELEPLEPFELEPIDIAEPDDEQDLGDLDQLHLQPLHPEEDEAADEADEDTVAHDADSEADDDTIAAEAADDEETPARVFPELASRGRRAVPNFRFDLKGSDHSAQAEPEVPAKPRDRDLDFDLPGFGASDPWTAWPAGPQQAAKTGPVSATSDSSSTVAEQLADALFGNKAPATDLPRVLGGRPALERSDWPSDAMPAGAATADDDAEPYEEGDETYAEYDEDYYDEAEPEWDDEGRALAPDSLSDMDAGLGLAARPRRKLGRPVAAAILLLLLVGGGYAAYSLMSGTEQAADGPPPVIQADAEGVKVMADGADQTDGGKTVYDRVGEDTSESGRLVQSQEVPIDPSQSAGAESPISSPLLPKRVRTVVVRPDGTIIPADELDAAQGQTGGLVAPSAESTASGDAASEVATSPTPTADNAPQTAADSGQTPNLAEDSETSLPGVTVPTEEDTALAETNAEAASAPVLSPIRTSERIAAQPSPAPAPRPATGEGTRTVSTSRVTSPPATQQRGPLSLVPDAPGTDTADASATTAPRTLPSPSRPAAQQPVGDRVSPAVLAAQNQRANQPQGTQTAAAAPAATTAPAPTGDWAVQVSSQRTADQARAAYQQLQRKFPSVLGSREPSIQAADLGDRGTFYRVRLPTQTRDAANQLCADLKAAGGDCFIGRN
ncbi:hypothetical protein AB7M35_000044 [Amorphus suaedae]